MQSTWTGDGKRKQTIIERGQLEQALLSEAVRQLKPGPIRRQGEQYWFRPEDLLIFLLVSSNDQAALINRAIEELRPPPANNPKPINNSPPWTQNRCARPELITCSMKGDVSPISTVYSERW